MDRRHDMAESNLLEGETTMTAALETARPLGETMADTSMETMRSDESFAQSVATTSSIMLIDESEMTPEQLKAYKAELAAVKSANRRVSLAGSIGGLLVRKTRVDNVWLVGRWRNGFPDLWRPTTMFALWSFG